MLLVELGKIIQAVRTSRNLSRSELAAQLFCDKTAIDKLEVGKYSPSYNLLSRIALALDLNSEQLSFLAGRPKETLQCKLEALYLKLGYDGMLEAIELMARPKLED
jgi:transcriptional regulator with XRE-family HTH domain